MRAVSLSLLLIPLLLSTCTSGHTAARPAPSNQGSFIVSSLRHYAGSYWARVAGRDTGQPPHTNGHDEFAREWTAQALSALHGLHASVFRQRFHTPGFQKLPATLPGVNVVVTVPGVKHPGQAVIVGTHYDGEPFSKGSAYDDTSGSMITLGLARTMGKVWRAKGPPDRTVEFVLFDAEEEGLVGSLWYAHGLKHGAAMPKPVLMIDEEQSGVAYPVRPFGLRSRDPLPSYAITVSGLPTGLGTPRPVPRKDLLLLTQRVVAARDAAFTQLHSRYSPMQFRGGSASVFTKSDESDVQVGGQNQCCSDNDPFQLAGIPNLTLSGDYGFYFPNPPSWSYPFDQPWDTAENLACDTGGSPTPSAALQAALDLPAVMSARLIQQYSPSRSGSNDAPIVFSDLLVQGKPVHLTALAPSTPHWSVNGHAFSGKTITVTFPRAGTYRVQVRSGKATTAWSLTVNRRAPKFRRFPTVSPPPIRPWKPKELQDVPGCH